MNTLRTVLLLALILAPATAAAQVVHITKDPEPKTKRCQNTASAYHADGDVVRVDYHGQWRELANGHRLQNGGPDYSSCATERIVRVGADDAVVWTVEPADIGLSRADRVSQMVARPDGKTLMSVSDGELDDHVHSAVLLLDTNGELLWSFRTKQAPEYTRAQAFVGDGGEVFVEYHTTNYGYKGGKFQLPGGRVWTLRPNEMKSIIARVDPQAGTFIWEREGASIVTAKGGEVLTYGVQNRSGRPTRERLTFSRVSYAGKRLSRARTPWLKSEAMTSIARFGDEVWVTTNLDKLDASNGGVRESQGRLRVFDLHAKLLHTRPLSQGARLATPAKGAPMRIVSPSNCTRGVSNGPKCVADALDVLELASWRKAGTATRIRVPGHRFEHGAFQAVSTAKGLWLSALTYYQHDAHSAEAVIRMYSPDAARAQRKKAARFVWKPRPKPTPTSSTRLKLSF